MRPEDHRRVDEHEEQSKIEQDRGEEVDRVGNVRIGEETHGKGCAAAKAPREHAGNIKDFLAARTPQRRRRDSVAKAG